MELITCVNCGEEVEASELIEVAGGDLVCQSCLEDNYSYCEHCGHYEIADDFECIEDCHEWWCGSCIDVDAAQCDVCGKYFSGDSCTALSNYATCVCEECLLENYIQCENCGEWVEMSDVVERDNGYYYCEDCAPNKIIKIYHEPWDISFRGLQQTERAQKLAIGLELEVAEGGTDDNNAENIINILSDDYIIIMEDSSLNKGFEIITQPATLQYHMGQEWQEAFTNLRAREYTSHDAGCCGLHFHLDRTYLSSNTAYETDLARFVLNNQEWLKIFSRRNSFSYCEFYQDGTTEDEVISSGRYQAINFRNSSTVEIRFCRGTLKLNTFIASLQLMQIIGELTHYCSIREASLMTIINKAENCQYSELLAYLKERELILEIEEKEGNNICA